MPPEIASSCGRPLSPAQIRGARGMLAWSMIDLAKAADVSVSTIKRMETGRTQPVPSGTHALVEGALRSAGIRFSLSQQEGEGIHLRIAPEAEA